MAPPPENIRYHAGMGFWVRTYANDVAVDADLEAVSAAVEVPLRNGWNQIGDPFSFTVSVSDLKVRSGGTELSLLDAQAQGWVSAYLFGYDTASGGYVMIDPASGCVQPWHGYWMRMYRDDCVLIVPPTECSSLSTAGQPLSSKELRARGIDVPPSPPVIPQASEQVCVIAVPNPVRDVHTVTFHVQGIDSSALQSLRVEIYNLAGRLVWKGEVAGNELSWHTDDSYGEYLANGVYLYRAYVKVGDEWLPTEVGKVAVIR
ncbi:MAG TPA: T9SS type A sorting domain-containing protein [Candidatus Acetothermia bacterium]|nr:T9SS type A sorting domain-containing protein [Candidatus Acetothermia bacterium]